MTTFRLTPALATHRGMRRRQNEDAVGHHYPLDDDTLRTYGALFIVADGVGGLERGADASQLAIELLTDAYYDQPAEHTPEERIARAIHQINLTIYKRLNRQGATTLVAAVIVDDRLITASVGDSLIFRVRGDEIVQMSEDDVVSSGTDESGALTQAVGYREQIEVETISGTIQAGDRLLLCSDGLTRYLEHEQLVRFAHFNDPRDGVRRMINEANAQGGADNISAVLVQIGAAISPTDAIAHIRSRVVPVAIDNEPLMTPAVNTKPTTQIPQAPAESRPSDTRTDPIPRASVADQPSQPAEATPRNTLAIAGFGVLLVGAAIVVLALVVSSGGQTPAPTVTPALTSVPGDAPVIQPTAPLNPTATEIDTVIDEGDMIQLSESVITRVRIADDVASFATSPATTYTVRSIVDDDRTGARWYELYDEANDRTGWLSASEMPAYTIVSQD